ncbi:MAG: hypothetical protein HRU70_14960 [Phycisphaeraceae bacterium]|nr:MAG: hypothetical protein HRU70_14960 [Phycisphaeraceae bacterium]
MIGSGRTVSVVEIDGPRLSAVAARVGKDRVEVKRWVSAIRPDGVSGEDGAAVGAWVGGELQRAGMPRSGAVMSVSRGDVVLKRLTLPAGSVALGEGEIGGAVRLQMARQLTVPLEGSAVDYAVLGPERDEGGGSGLAVMAGAMPAERVRWCLAVASAARLKLSRLSLRCFGVASLLGELSQRRGGTILAVAVGWGSTEFVIVEDGQMAFARAADTPRPTSRAEVEDFADRVSVEAKRTWMSYRSTRPGPAPEFVAVLGEGEFTRRVGERCGSVLEAPWEAVGVPGVVKLPEGMPESERSATAPLVGLLVERMLARSTLDFVNPKRMPDRAARRRQLVLAGVFGAIVVGGGGHYLAKKEIAKVESQAASLRDERARLEERYQAHLARHARLNHLKSWLDTRVDWLGHLSVLSGQVPAGGVAYADEVQGRMYSSVAFMPDGGANARTISYPKGDWIVQPRAEFDFEGRALERGVATDLRARLLQSDLYTVSTQGAEMSDRFALRLITARPSPAPPTPPPPGEGGSR